jgi:hypothetical protein
MFVPRVDCRLGGPGLAWAARFKEDRILDFTLEPVAQLAEVRHAPFGPGLWPGPRRQARWVGSGSGVKGGRLRPSPWRRAEGAPLTLEGAPRTMRGVPAR